MGVFVTVCPDNIVIRGLVWFHIVINLVFVWIDIGILRVFLEENRQLIAYGEFFLGGNIDS